MEVNFISKEEKEVNYSKGQIIDSKIKCRFEKIIKITYNNLSRTEYQNFNRKTDIFVEFFVAGKFNFMEFNPNNIPYFIQFRYHSRSFNFETMVPTTVPNLLNFRYIDSDGYQYFTVVNKDTNRICEAGFYDGIEMTLYNKCTIIVDYPERNFSQEVPFIRSAEYFEQD